ncbi:hypothetical protein ACLF3G_27875 [Falsiroseomonas sp. HC035]|uniref:hypothetical protein n=1 Tax=Falsiroseomonas sp. HC035 TaxID=3390999 RepID=UPI003D32288B
MIQSRPIEIDGRFVGVAVHSAKDWHLVAVDPALEDLHGTRFPSPADAERVARLVLRRARGGPPRPVLVPVTGFAG